MPQRQPGLDLLRAMAIVFVVVYHAGLFGFELPFRIQLFGWIGVALFFVLSIYLSHKLVIHWIEGMCAAQAIPPTSISALLILFAAITLLGAILFFAVERPFLQLRQRQIGTKADPTR